MSGQTPGHTGSRSKQRRRSTEKLASPHEATGGFTARSAFLQVKLGIGKLSGRQSGEIKYCNCDGVNFTCEDGVEVMLGRIGS